MVLLRIPFGLRCPQAIRPGDSKVAGSRGFSQNLRSGSEAPSTFPFAMIWKTRAHMYPNSNVQTGMTRGRVTNNHFGNKGSRVASAAPAKKNASDWRCAASRLVLSTPKQPGRNAKPVELQSRPRRSDQWYNRRETAVASGTDELD